MTDSLLSADYKKLISSFAPENKLEANIIDIQPYRNGSEAETASSWLTPSEIVQFNKYSFEKRRNEWLSGRICAKQSILNLMKNNNGGTSPGALDFSIKANHTGRPFVQFHNPTQYPAKPEISISHSHGKAVGLAGKGLCGIDIQLLNETLFKVKDRFCTDVEAAILNEIPADELVHLGMLWVAKEAVRKCLSGIKLTGFQELTLVQVSEVDGFFLLHFLPAIPGINFLDTDHISVITHFKDTYAIAVCTIDKGKLHAGTA